MAVTMTKILKLPLGGLHVKLTEQRGILVPTQIPQDLKQIGHAYDLRFSRR
jgi:hypothetical protein